MRRGAIALLLCALIVCSSVAVSWAGPPVRQEWVPSPASEVRKDSTAVFRDDFDDTAGLQEMSNLAVDAGYLKVADHVDWWLDTFADFFPGSGRGVDLYAQPGAMILSRFSPEVHVNDVVTGTQVQVDAAYSQMIGLEDTPYLYAVWADGRSGDLDIYFSRSTDGGASWDAGRKLNLIVTAGDQHDPAIAVDGASIHVVWTDDGGIHYTRSQDWGHTWLADSLLVAGGSAADIAAAVAAPLRLVHILYLAEELPGDVDVWALRSADDGLTWDAPQNVVAGEPTGARQYAPSVTVLSGSETAWAAWADDRDGETNIYAGQRVNGLTWTNLRVDSGPIGSVQSEPVIFFPAPNSEPCCLWGDARGGTADLYWARYDSDLLRWVELGSLSAPGASAPAVGSIIAGSAWAAWKTPFPGDYDTVRLRAYQGGVFGDAWTAPEHLPAVSRSAPAVAQADATFAAIAALWSDDRYDDGDIFVATSDGTYRMTGWYTSTVHDFGQVASWGPVSWTGSDIGWVTLETRSGDCPQPDSTWSPWVAAANGAIVPSPPARYLQLRLGLVRTADGFSPVLESVHVQAQPRAGWGLSIPIGRCVAAWDTLQSGGYTPVGTTMTLSVLDLTGTVLYSDVVTPLDLSGLSPTQYSRLRLGVDMERTPAASPFLDYWQVTWEEGTIQAAFSFEPQTIYTPTVLHFSNHSGGTIAPTGYLWDFGDGITSTAESPTHTYALAGPYTVTLTASGECGTDVATATLAVLPLPTAPPIAAFAHGPLCPGEVSFTNQSSGAIWWRWYFGDGAESGLEHPVHTYAAGDYTLTLAVTNTLGSDSTAARLGVRPAPTAAFTWTVDVLTVAFSATVSGDPALLWEFGDGVTSTLSNPVHTYAHSGTYTVTLVAANGCAAVSTCAPLQVTCAPVAGLDFSWQPASPQPGQVVTLTAVATGTPPLTFSWHLGDGSPPVVGPSSTVTHVYALSGTYTATVVAENRCGTQQAAHALAVFFPPAPVFRIYLPVLDNTCYRGDPYEPDDTPGQARPIHFAVPQEHTFSPENDGDWVWLELEAGVRYHFETRDLRGGADTILELYRGDLLVFSDDDGCPDYASCFDFVTATAGRYALRVFQYPGGAVWGPQVAYTLVVTRP